VYVEVLEISAGFFLLPGKEWHSQGARKAEMNPNWTVRPWASFESPCHTFVYAQQSSNAEITLICSVARKVKSPLSADTHKHI